MVLYVPLLIKNLLNDKRIFCIVSSTTHSRDSLGHLFVVFARILFDNHFAQLPREQLPLAEDHPRLRVTTPRDPFHTFCQHHGATESTKGVC